MSSHLEEEIQKKLQALPEEQQRHVLSVIEGFLGDAEQSRSAEARPISEIFEALSRQIPIEEWSKLPSDGAEQHDHYLYGAPKRKNQ